jgi:hypothetical protein
MSYTHHRPTTPTVSQNTAPLPPTPQRSGVLHFQHKRPTITCGENGENGENGEKMGNRKMGNRKMGNRKIGRIGNCTPAKNRPNRQLRQLPRCEITAKTAKNLPHFQSIPVIRSHPTAKIGRIGNCHLAKSPISATAFRTELPAAFRPRASYTAPPALRAYLRHSCPYACAPAMYGRGVCATRGCAASVYCESDERTALVAWDTLCM